MMKFKIYYINLDRSADKRNFMEAQLSRSGFAYDRIPAVDGRSLDEANLSDFSIPKRVAEWRHLLTANAIGCSLSHYKAYTSIIEDDVEIAMILEDDVALLPEFSRVISASLDFMNKSDVVLIYFHGANKIFLVAEKAAVCKTHGIYQAKTAWGAYAAGGYMLHREVARRLKDHVFPVHTTADSWGTFRRDGVIGKLRAILPPITTDAPFGSDIGYGKWSELKMLAFRGRYSPFRHVVLPYRKYIRKISHEYMIVDEEPEPI